MTAYVLFDSTAEMSRHDSAAEAVAASQALPNPVDATIARADGIDMSGVELSPFTAVGPLRRPRCGRIQDGAIVWGRQS